MTEPLRLPVECDDCVRKDKIIRQYAESETKKAEELSGAWDTIQTQGKELTRLKGRLTRQDRESAKLEQVQQVVECWRKHRPKASKGFGKPGTTSFALIEKALVLMAEEDGGAVAACCEAIEGLHLAPYQEFERRYAVPGGPDRVLRRELVNVFGDEVRIERCRNVARNARALKPERAVRAWQLACEVEQAWFRVMMGDPGYKPEACQEGQEA